MTAVYKRTADQDYEGSKLKKHNEFLDHYRLVLDFELFTRTVRKWMTNMNGSPLVKGKFKHDHDKPEIQNWNCKKYEPNKKKN